MKVKTDKTPTERFGSKIRRGVIMLFSKKKEGRSV